MKIKEFKIGHDFIMSNAHWRCTDIGTRTVCAIKIDFELDKSWFKGPPYAVVESVIDETCLSACTPYDKNIFSESTFISVSKHYSNFPAGRFKTDGEFSAERFREEFLLPALNKGHVLVNLDGTIGYSSNWLHETFGKLKNIYTFKYLRNALSIVSERDESLVKEVWEYIKSS